MPYTYNPGDQIIDLVENIAIVKTTRGTYESDLTALFESWLSYQIFADDADTLTESAGDNRRWRYCKRSVKILDDNTLKEILEANDLTASDTKKDNVRKVRELMDRLPEEKKAAIANNPEARKLEKLATQNDWKTVGKNILINAATCFIGVGVMVGNNLSRNYRKQAKAIRLELVTSALKDGALTEDAIFPLFVDWLESKILDEEYLEENSHKKKLRHHTEARDNGLKISEYYGKEHKKYASGKTDSDKRHADSMLDKKVAAEQDAIGHSLKLQRMEHGKEIAKAKAIDKKGGNQPGHESWWGENGPREMKAIKKTNKDNMGKDHY